MIVEFVRRLKRKKYIIKEMELQDTVRVGNQYGGYNVCADLLNSKSIVYSFGVGEDLSFEEELISKHKTQVFSFDPTPKAISYVKNHDLNSNPLFHFYTVGISDKDGKSMFYLPLNKEYVSGSSVIKSDKEKDGIEVDMKNIRSIMKENDHDHIDLLKIDVEGSEFQIVQEWYENSIPKINQICLEVHDRFFDDGYDKLVTLISQMKGMGYKLIYSQDTYEELTFLNNNMRRID